MAALNMDIQVLKAMLKESKTAESLLSQLQDMPINSSMEYHPLVMLIYAVGMGRISESDFYLFVVSQYQLIKREISSAMARKNKDERGVTNMLKNYLATYAEYITMKKEDAACASYFMGVD